MSGSGASERRPRSLERRLLRDVGRAVGDFAMIDDGDRILVGLSGGKDSAVLLRVLRLLQRRAPVRYELLAANLDPGYDGYRPDVVAEFARSEGVAIELIDAPIRQLVAQHLEPGQLACPLCSRIRRGALYTLANRRGCNKLALGHHLDDVLETLLLNLFYAGALRAMAPSLRRQAGPPMVIRPLCYALERDVAAYAQAEGFPLIPCASPSCGAADQRRQRVKGLLGELEREHADLKPQMRRALANIDPAFLFDRRWQDDDAGASKE